MSKTKFGIIEMQKFAEQSGDERVKRMWSKICDYRRRMAIWTEQLVNNQSKTGVTLATAYAVSLLESGWTVRHNPIANEIEWRRPDGIGCSEWRSYSLDDPPRAVVSEAIRLGQIRELHWVST